MIAAMCGDFYQTYRGDFINERKKLYLLKEVTSGETVEELSKRLNLSVEFIERLQRLAKRVIRKGGK
ncbi:MAG: hypothetical protein E7I33_04185 [Mixta calida]|nr:hypothetical protein [Mixta calida]